jgi:hypothetical protein
MLSLVHASYACLEATKGITLMDMFMRISVHAWSAAFIFLSLQSRSAVQTGFSGKTTALSLFLNHMRTRESRPHVAFVMAKSVELKLTADRLLFPIVAPCPKQPQPLRMATATQRVSAHNLVPGSW